LRWFIEAGAEIEETYKETYKKTYKKTYSKAVATEEGIAGITKVLAFSLQRHWH
jgi:hypothetical protein